MSTSADEPKKIAGFLRWVLARKRILMVDAGREQLTRAAEIIEELSEKNERLGDAYERLLNEDKS